MKKNNFLDDFAIFNLFVFILTLTINLIGTIIHYLKEGIWWWLDMDIATIFSHFNINIPYFDTNLIGLNKILNFIFHDIDLFIASIPLAIGSFLLSNLIKK